jgi:predicted phage tail protein
LLAPVTGKYVNEATDILDWTDVAYADRYEIKLSKYATFSTPTLVPVTASTWEVDGLPDGTYFWKVRAINSENTAGLWSAVRVFTLDTVLPAVPVLHSPLNAATTHSHNPGFVWHASTGALTYQLHITNGAGFDYSSPYTTLTAYVAPALAHGAYTWEVRAKDRAGNLSAWSPAWALTIAP